MKWTRDKPTEAGFYWLRNSLSTGINMDLSVVTVVAYHTNYDDRGSSGFTKLGMGVLYEGLYSDLEGEFYGPITPPPDEDAPPSPSKQYISAWDIKKECSRCGALQLASQMSFTSDTGWVCLKDCTP